MFTRLALLLVAFYAASADISSSEFCKLCTCNGTTSDVTCTTRLSQDVIFNGTKYWIDQATNKSYDFKTVAIHKSGITVVTPILNSTLQVLDLSGNSIQVIVNGSFAELQNMHTLLLSNNELTSESLHKDTFQGKFTPGEYKPLRSLKVLKLDGNDIHVLPQDFFSHTTHLEVLDLHGNPIKFLDVNTQSSLGVLLGLKVLDMSYMELKEIPVHFFHAFRRLEVLNLTGNELARVPDALSSATNLQYLSLNDNSIVNITEKTGFPAMPGLKVLHLSHLAGLERIEKHSMGGLGNLTELYITDNPKLTHLDSEALIKRSEHVEADAWPPIRKVLDIFLEMFANLYLRNNKLSYLDFNFLPHWGELQDIEIRENPWACECETQWIADHLIHLVDKIDPNKARHVACASPVEMKDKLFLELTNENYIFRCLDFYGNRPERDAGIVIGILVGLLLGIPIVLGVYFCYKRNWFGYFESGPASYSRKFYSRTSSNNDDVF